MEETQMILSENGTSQNSGIRSLNLVQELERGKNTSDIIVVIICCILAAFTQQLAHQTIVLIILGNI